MRSRLAIVFVMITLGIGTACDSQVADCLPAAEVEARALALPVKEVTADNLPDFANTAFFEAIVTFTDGGEPYPGRLVEFDFAPRDFQGELFAETDESGVARAPLADLRDGTTRGDRQLAGRLNERDSYNAVVDDPLYLLCGGVYDEAPIVLGGDEKADN